MILDLMSDIASKMSLLTKYKGDKGHKSPSDGDNRGGATADAISWKLFSSTK